MPSSSQSTSLVSATWTSWRKRMLAERAAELLGRENLPAELSAVTVASKRYDPALVTCQAKLHVMLVPLLVTFVRRRKSLLGEVDGVAEMEAA